MMEHIQADEKTPHRILLSDGRPVCAIVGGGHENPFTKEEMQAHRNRIVFCVNACSGIPDAALLSWMFPPDGSKGAPHGTWAEQLAEAGRQQVEMQKQIHRLLAIAKVFRSHLGGALWTLADDERELAVSVDSAIAEAEAVR